MIIGLTPFLYLYNNAETLFFQDGKFTIIVGRDLCNREKSKLLRSFLLTMLPDGGIINLLGGLQKTAFFRVRTPGGEVL